MVLVYLPTKLRDFGQGQMLVRIFQQHGLHMGYDKPLADQGYSDVHKNTHLATGHSWSKLQADQLRLQLDELRRENRMNLRRAGGLVGEAMIFHHCVMV